jgi:hypothetical protein
MADPGHDNDFPDLSSFDDESSVISVSGCPSIRTCDLGGSRKGLGAGQDRTRQDRTNRGRNNDRREDSRHSAAK